MTMNDGFDRELHAWLDENAGAGAPDYLAETLSAIDNLNQRPSWAFPGRWLPGGFEVRRAIPILAIVTLVLVGGLLALALAGSRPRVPTQLPPPYGLARPGLIAFDMDGQIVLANPDGSDIRPLHPSGLPPKDSKQFGATFSRDGTRVAFWQEYGWKLVDGASTQKASDLWVVDVDGSNAVDLTPDVELAPWAGFPAGAWSPDGSEIAFVSDKDMPMYVVATDGRSQPRMVGEVSILPMQPAWSPDGSRIAFAGVERLPDDVLGPGKVWVVNADGTGQEQVSRDGAGDGTGGMPQWSPDGRMLVYGVDVTPPRAPGDPPSDEPPTEIEIVTAERGPAGWAERVVVPASPIWVTAFSNDGSRIAFFRRRPGIFEGDLFVVGVDGKDERMVSDQVVNVSWPCWSPDDAEIAMLTGPIPPGGEAAGFGWPNQAYTLFPVDGGSPAEIPAGRVDGVFACSWQRLAP